MYHLNRGGQNVRQVWNQEEAGNKFYLPYYSILKMEAAIVSETSMDFQPITLSYNP